MSANARPEIRAIQELEMLVRHLGEELAAFRRRALAAEAQLRGAGHGASGRAKAGASERLTELETENERLRRRITGAEESVRQMMERVRFLRQQLQHHSVAGAGGRR